MVMVRMMDGAKPQHTFKPADFLASFQKQQSQAKEALSCSEAGPTGFWLHRELTALGYATACWHFKLAGLASGAEPGNTLIVTFPGPLRSPARSGAR
jgi:hypothetical protein